MVDSLDRLVPDRIIFIMGVSGSGKTIIGETLAQEFELIFIDADDLHPKHNIDKMRQGIPLNDQDRDSWLTDINLVIKTKLQTGGVIACSALKERYREKLESGIAQDVVWVYLKGEYNQIFERISKRKKHFMKANMLQSQFDVLEEPSNAITVDISESPESILNYIKRSIADG